MRYLQAQCVPSLFRALHSDADFVASICASEFSPAFLMQYLALVPTCFVSMEVVLGVVVGRSEDLIFSRNSTTSFGWSGYALSWIE